MRVTQDLVVFAKISQKSWQFFLLYVQVLRDASNLQNFKKLFCSFHVVGLVEPDLSLPHSLQKLVEALERNNEHGFYTKEKER